MATKVVKKEDGSTKEKKKLDKWKFPKIPVHKLYKKSLFRIFPSYSINSYENTITYQIIDKLCSVLTRDFLEGFIKRKHKFVHLGLVQVAIKPLVRDGLEAPIILCLRDARHQNFKNSLLAVVETNLSQGAFYFNCFPNFSVSLTDTYYDRSLLLTMKSRGNPTGVSMALMVRIVCKAMVDLRAEYLEETELGKTTYFNATSGNSATTQWDEVVHDN